MIVLNTQMIRSLFKITAWEKESFGRRLLCAFGRVFGLFTILAVVGYLILAHEYEIEARVWHWRHGYSTTIGGYEIPVPAHWLVLSQTYKRLTMVNISRSRPKDGSKSYTAPLITVNVGLLSLARDAAWMSKWASLQRKRLANDKVESVMSKTLNLANETVSCIGGNELDALLHDRPDLPRTQVVSLDCMSDHGLDVMFVGQPPDVESFYILLSQMRRRS